MVDNKRLPYNDLPLLPPKTDIETIPVLKAAISANKAVTELKNKAALLPNQNILLSTMALREAKDSSEMENIVTTNDKLYKAVITSEQLLDHATKEIRRYNKALWCGYDDIKSKPLSTNTFIKLAQIIKESNEGIRKLSGTTLSNNRGEIIYTPPEGESVIRDKLKNLEDFLYDEKYSDIDILIKMAVMHYQFEAIHPFSDGNGRTGRVINILYLVQEKLLDKPILYLSKYFLDNPAGYYNGLQNITTNDEWEQWILYILKAVEETSLRTIQIIEAVRNEMDFYKQEIKQHFTKIYSYDLVETLFDMPYFRLEDILSKGLVKSRQTASGYLQKLTNPYDKNGQKIQLIESKKIGRENIYLNIGLYSILNDKATF